MRAGSAEHIKLPMLMQCLGHQNFCMRLFGLHFCKENDNSCFTLSLLVSIPLQQLCLSTHHCPEASWLQRQWIQQVRHQQQYKPHDDTTELKHASVQLSEVLAFGHKEKNMPPFRGFNSAYRLSG